MTKPAPRRNLRKVKLPAGAALRCRGGPGGGLRRFDCGGLGGLFHPGRSVVREPQRLAQVVLDFVADILVFLEEHARVLTALAQALVLVGNPCAGFFEQAI